MTEDPKYYFDDYEANKVKKWIETNCVQSKYPFAGRKIKLMSWQWNRLIKPAYSWYKNELGPLKEKLFRYDTVLCFLPRRQGKSAIIATLGLYELAHTLGGEIIIVSASVDQAKHLFEYIADFIELGPLGKENLEDGKERYWVRRHLKTIEDRKTRSTIQCLSSDPADKAGRNINVLICDEITSWPPCNARLVWDRLQGSFANRPNHRTFVISSAQYDLTCLGYELYRKAIEIQSGEKKEPHTLAIVYALSNLDDWRNPENWKKCLPSLRENDPNGVVDFQFYLDEYEKCKGSPSDETRFKTDYCNMFCGSATQWIEPATWNKCALKFSEEHLAKQNDGCVGGLDLAYRGDLGAYTLIVKKGDLFYLLPRFFSPQQLAKQKEKADSIPITQWAKVADNHIYLTEGDTIDPEYIKRRILEDQKLFGKFPIRYDEWGAELFRQQMENEGVEMIGVASHAGVMSPPTGFFERLILDERIKHPNNPLANWCLGNCVPQVDNYERITVSKTKSRKRIDFVIATIIGFTHFLGDGEQTESWEGGFISGF